MNNSFTTIALQQATVRTIEHKYRAVLICPADWSGKIVFYVQLNFLHNTLQSLFKLGVCHVIYFISNASGTSLSQNISVIKVAPGSQTEAALKRASLASYFPQLSGAMG